ncbi:MAG: DUF3810 family protein [Vicinamibacterales bacterium]
MTRPLLLAALAAAALVVPIPAALVEQFYSSALFPLMQRALTSASNLTAVPWLDLLIVLVVAGVGLRTLRDARRWPLSRVAARLTGRLVSVAAVVCLAFILVWGLNYRRAPLREKVPFEPARITVDAAAALAREAVAHVNALHAQAHAAGWPAADAIDPALAESFRRTLPSLSMTASTVPGRPKRSLLDLYFRRAGVAGMTDPFFLETLMASDILPFERPHVVAHEWAHLAGVTDEGEANFVGWLTCLHGTPSHQYSGWLFLYSEVLSGLPRDHAHAISAVLAEGPRADLLAIRERSLREVNPRVSGAGWLVYDQYLKANRIEAGTASYAQVVQWVLGTELR